MKHDLFLSICQTEVDGYLPSERKLFEQYFDQVQLADQLGFDVAWVAETHLSCQIQKETSYAVIPNFKGEIGLNTDILQLAHITMAKTKRIEVGSAIRNIICNGGPIAHAEAVRTFLTLHQFTASSDRRLHLGFAAGRFPFSNAAYGMVPKTELEKIAWDQVKGKYFKQACEIFLRLLRGDVFSSADLSAIDLSAKDFSYAKNGPKIWNQLIDRFKIEPEGSLLLEPHWNFEKLGLVPKEVSLDKLVLTVGNHDPEVQIFVNQFLPVGVFNLSITPAQVIEETHLRMQQHYHKDGGTWTRSHMPRTVMLYIDDSPGKSLAAKRETTSLIAKKSWQSYWSAMEGTVDPKKVEQSVSNTVAGAPEDVLEQLKSKYHADDRLMLWFDFNVHDNEFIKQGMKAYMEKIAPHL